MNTTIDRATTGITGLDAVLDGGFPRNRLYLLQGDPGAGKTTLALQFLLEGVKRGEKVLYITLSETIEELKSVAASHGWSLDGINTFELAAIEESLKFDNLQTIFPPSEIELNQTTQKLLAECIRVEPARVVFDSLAEMRLLAQSGLRYRRQILALKHFFAGRNCTVLLLDDRTSDVGDIHVQSLAHGVIGLEQTLPDYGAERRRMRVIKLRAVKFTGGYHDFHIRTGGIVVHPRVHTITDFKPVPINAFPSGNDGLDEMLCGGLERGTSVLLIGPAGAGKSTVAVHYMSAAVKRGERGVLFSFEEGPGTFYSRSKGMGIDVEKHIKDGKLAVKQLNPAALSAGQFTESVKESVEKDNASILVIDSLNGYLNAVTDERFLTVHLRDLLTWLSHRQVLTIMIVAQQGMMGPSMVSPVDVSYVADTVLLFRFFEHAGRIHKALSVLKKRSGKHETTIRELAITERGIEVGAALKDFQGVLTGVPVFKGSTAELLKRTS